MRSLVELISYVSAAAALLLALYAIAISGRTGTPGRWGAAAFAALATVLVVATFDEELDGQIVAKVVIALLLAFPYFLLRFAVSFGTGAARWVRTASVLAAAMLIVTLALPELPQDTEPQPGWVTAYILGLLVYWTVLSVITILALWRPGTGQPTLARRRTRLLSVATGALNVLILTAGVSLDDPVAELVIQLLLLLSLLLFGLGFGPPRFVRLSWRGPEQEALQQATEQLMGADSVSDVATTLLPHVVAMVGGSGAALLAEDRETILASVGDRAASSPETTGRAQTEVVIPLSPPFGSLVVTTSPLTPFFGHEEISLLHSLGALADLSLARCILTDAEREGRAALERAMEEIERANSAKNDFLSRMSHELRTPLNVVLGFGQLLEMGEIDDDQRRSVGHILSAGRHLLDLVNEVLDLSRIESGRMTISPEPVELADLAGEAIDLIRPLADDRGIRIVAGLETCHHLVVADRQRLKQVVLNLLSNAVKYNRDGGEVELSCREAGPDRLSLLVRDTGPGIPRALRDKLFEPFERLGADQAVEGTGLGLALSKQLVELMGGTIGVDTEEGEGSTFWVELAMTGAPVGDAGERAPDEMVAERTSTALTRRVLLIEDNLANLKLIEALLEERAGTELLPAMTGRLGVELAREHQPDLILLDQHLPDIPGAEVLQRLKATPETRAIPVVIVSADATPGQLRRVLELGAVAYVTKPIDVPAFLELLDQLLGTGAAS
jgi:signal transduction histidine kinase/ActR/RegA family two-component response regulator